MPYHASILTFDTDIMLFFIQCIRIYAYSTYHICILLKYQFHIFECFHIYYDDSEGIYVYEFMLIC